MSNLFRKEYLDYKHSPKIVNTLGPSCLPLSLVFIVVLQVAGVIYLSLQLSYTAKAQGILLFNEQPERYVLVVEPSLLQGVEELMVHYQKNLIYRDKTVNLQESYRCDDKYCLHFNIAEYKTKLVEIEYSSNNAPTVELTLTKRYF
jgi:hypothetical protein